MSNIVLEFLLWSGLAVLAGAISGAAYGAVRYRPNGAWDSREMETL